MQALIRTSYYGVLAAAIAVFSFSMLYTLHGIRSGQSSIVQITALNFWNASQARLELERLIGALDAYALESGRVGRADLRDRFDIFWSRLPLLIEGEQNQVSARTRPRRRPRASAIAGLDMNLGGAAQS